MRWCCDGVAVGGKGQCVPSELRIAVVGEGWDEYVCGGASVKGCGMHSGVAKVKGGGDSGVGVLAMPEQTPVVENYEGDGRICWRPGL
ncbi:hypothetical protein Tco_1561173 [Tanacetum coccineum]